MYQQYQEMNAKSSSEAYFPAWLRPSPISLDTVDGQEKGKHIADYLPLETGVGQISLKDSKMLLESKNGQFDAIKLGNIYGQKESHLQTCPDGFWNEEQMTSSKAVFPKQDMMSPLSPGAKKVTEMMNHYKEKCVKLECDLATMRRKWDVLSEKFDDFEKVVSANKQMVTDYKVLLEELSKQNQELESEAARWKSMSLQMQQQRAPHEKQPVRKEYGPTSVSNKPFFYQDTKQSGSAVIKTGLLIQNPSESDVISKDAKGRNWY